MTELMGWTSKDMPTTPGAPDYTQFYVGDKTVAGGSPMPPNMPGVPSMWNNYVTVDNVDAMTNKAVTLGATVAMPVMDVMDAGKMSAIADPQGAHLFLWQPKKHIGAEMVNAVGCMSWNELYTKDVEGSKKFYAALFGWTYETDDKTGYVTIKNNGRMNGGIFAITPQMGQMPPKWMVYFTVKSAKDTAEKVKQLGGKVWDQKDISIGTIIIISDPTGASFIAMEMSVPPSEWVD